MLISDNSRVRKYYFLNQLQGYELVKQMQSNKDEDSISLASDSSYTPSEKDMSELEDDIEESKSASVSNNLINRQQHIPLGCGVYFFNK